MLARLFSKLTRRNRAISDGLVDLLVEMAKFEQPDREAAPVSIVITGGQITDREALRTYERAGLGYFA